MAELVKWLTHRIVAPACKGSTPLFRPILNFIILLLTNLNKVIYNLFVLLD